MFDPVDLAWPKRRLVHPNKDRLDLTADLRQIARVDDHVPSCDIDLILER